MDRSKSPIKILQYMCGNQEYFPWSEKINRAYCDRHGYEYTISHEEPRSDRHIVWQKIPVILHELKKRDCEYLLFLDADAHFYSHELTIEDELIPLLETKLILMAQDIGGEKVRWTPGKPNSGVILMKNCIETVQFIEEWNGASDVDQSTRWTWPPTQRALWKIVLPKYQDILKVHPEYYLIQGRYGLFIRHYVLTSNEIRLREMKRFCQRKCLHTGEMK